MTRRKGRKEWKTSESKSHIEFIGMLTVKILQSVERFDTQNTRAPAFFVAFGMGTRVG